MEVKIDTPKISGAPSGVPSGLKMASGTLGDIITLVSQGEKLFSHISSIVTTLKGGQVGATESNIITSDRPPKTNIQSPQKSSSEKKREISDKEMSDFVMSPDGIKKIAEAIDKLIPVTGDIKLSQLKNALIGEKKNGARSKK